MYIIHLSLTNFRNFTSLELALPRQHIVIRGENAQGKTNLLEALYMLSTTKSYRTNNEKELINWSALAEQNSVTRILGNLCQRGDTKIEIVLRSEEGGLIQKRIRVNDITRRASEVIGQANMVLFEAQDLALSSGPTALRRRYLDLIGSQIDHRYLYSLQRYNRVLTQRNHLLRLINEGQAKTDQLEFWDNELAQHGTYLTIHRQQLIIGINELVYMLYQKLSGDEETLEIKYLPRLKYDPAQTPSEEALISLFREQLQQSRGQEISAGITLVGPHRDDLRFLVNGIDIGIYGSRGQQRTAILALKLAQAEHYKAQTGDYPIMLLDDVLSELDREHRRQLLEFATSLPQVFLTTTDVGTVEASFLSRAVPFQIVGGNIT